MGVVERRDAIERFAGKGIGVGGVGEGIELVERGPAGGNELRMFSPRGILDDLIEGRSEHPTTAGRTP